MKKTFFIISFLVSLKSFALYPVSVCGHLDVVAWSDLESDYRDDLKRSEEHFTLTYISAGVDVFGDSYSDVTVFEIIETTKGQRDQLMSTWEKASQRGKKVNVCLAGEYSNIGLSPHKALPDGVIFSEIKITDQDNIVYSISGE